MIIWTDYLKYRANLRGFDLDKIENIIKYSEEQYYDTEKNRFIKIGKHGSKLVMIPFEEERGDITPITIHVTTRQQINLRLKSGRFKYE